MPQLIDNDTPQESQTRMGFDGNEYQLVFSDEFTKPGRTFYPGDDPFWEAVDLWYGATGDLEWYDPSQVTTRDGALVITMDSTATLTPGVTPSKCLFLSSPFLPSFSHVAPSITRLHCPFHCRREPSAQLSQRHVTIVEQVLFYDGVHRSCCCIPRA
jgi:hypothetical protein